MYEVRLCDGQGDMDVVATTTDPEKLKATVLAVTGKAVESTKRLVKDLG